MVKRNSVRSSGKIASKAGRILGSSRSKATKALAGSVLSNAKKTSKK